MLGRLMLAASSGRLLLLRGRFLQLGVSCPLQGPESIVLLVTGRLLLPCLQHGNTAMRLQAEERLVSSSRNWHDLLEMTILQRSVNCLQAACTVQNKQHSYPQA